MSSRRVTRRRSQIPEISAPKADSASVEPRESEADLRAIIDAVPSPIAYLDREGRYRLSNRAHQQWHHPEPITGTTFADLIDPRAYAEIRGHFDAALDGHAVTFETVVDFRGVGKRWVEVSYTPWREASGEVSGVIVQIHDISPRRLAEQDHAIVLAREKEAREQAERTAMSLTRLQALTSRLSGALTPSQVAAVVVQESVTALGGSACVLIVPSAESGALEVAATYGVPRESREGPPRRLLDAPAPLVNAFISRQPEVLETLEEVRARYPDVRGTGATFAGTGALLTIPLLIEGSNVGALGVSFASDRRFSEEERAFAFTVARQCAQALDRARLYEAEIRANQALRLLAQAGDVLSASFDHDSALRNDSALLDVAQLMLPALGDLCFFDIVEGGEVRRVSRAHGNTEAEALLKRTRWTRPLSHELNLSAHSTGRSGYHPEVDDRWMDRAAQISEGMAMMRPLKICSLITVPVTSGKATLGALTLCFAWSGRHHTTTDLVLAEELARRTATALENARLHRDSKEANRISEQANRAKDEFLGVVSHELRTPLNAILGWSQLLSGDRVTDPAVVRKGVAVIERNARAQVKLIEDILDVSRIISGKLRLEPRPLDLDWVLHASVEVVRPAADAKGVNLVVRSEPGVIVSGDPDRLQQVVWNLLANAVKFTPKDGTVEIRLVQAERSARIVVRDTGKGIDSAFLPYVFERFRQADSSTTRRHGGLGLGLSIVRHVVELHGGTVRVESEGSDRGSTFTVKLPLRTSGAGRELPQRPALDSDPSMLINRLDGLRVLVVDDEFDAREMIAALLTVSGADVSVAGSSDEALIALASSGVDVLVSDVGMPGDDGYALIRKIRASGAPYSRVPALALTAYAGPEDARRAALAGFHNHLPKPAEPAVLTAMVANLGGRSTPAPQ